MCVATALIYWALETHAESTLRTRQSRAIDKTRVQGNLSLQSLILAGGRPLLHVLFRDFSVSHLRHRFFHQQDTGVPMAVVAAMEVVRVHPWSRPAASTACFHLSAMIATPLFGLLVDRMGKRAWFMMFGSLLLMPVYLMMAYSNISLYVPVALMGIAFSLIPAVMWPSVAYIVDESRLGTAYALMTLIQQIGFFHHESADRKGE